MAYLGPRLRTLRGENRPRLVPVCRHQGYGGLIVVGTGAAGVTWWHEYQAIGGNCIDVAASTYAAEVVDATVTGQIAEAEHAGAEQQHGRRSGD